MATAEARGEGRFSGGAALTRRVAFVRSISSVYLIHAHMQIHTSHTVRLCEMCTALPPVGAAGAATRDDAHATGRPRARPTRGVALAANKLVQ